MSFRSNSFISNNPFKYFFVILLVTLGAITTTSCTSEPNSTLTKSDNKVVTTFLPIYLFTKAITGSSNPIEILVPPGSEVHDYQATPQNAASVATASILVKNGLGQEEFLEDLINNAGNPQLKEIDASKGLNAIDIKDEHHDHEEHDNEHHDHEGKDPHLWLDPVLAQEQVKNIRDALIAAYPEQESVYKNNGEQYLSKLEALDLKFRQTLAPVKGCRFITFHDAFSYLARRYELQQVAVVEIPEAMISPQDIQRVSQAVTEFQVKAIFIEPGMDANRILQIAQDLNLSVETLDPITSGETDPQYYFQVMEQNLASLEKACK